MFLDFLVVINTCFLPKLNIMLFYSVPTVLCLLGVRTVHDYQSLHTLRVPLSHTPEGREEGRKGGREGGRVHKFMSEPLILDE